MTGIFTVNQLGQVEIDFIYDGGWYQGELVAFNLEGMDAYEAGSLEYVQEAARRGLSNSNEGFVAIDDRNEGAKWGGEYNAGEYEGIKSFSMNAGDEFALMLIQNTTAEELFYNPSSIYQWGKTPLFSVSELNIEGDLTQMVSVDNNGTIAFDDISVNRGGSDRNYQDFVVQVRGADTDAPDLAEVVNPAKGDWRETEVGQEILNYTDRNYYSAGVFEVGDTGEVTFDFLYDGGWYQGELAIFSLEGMDYMTPGSHQFIEEATRRALSNSTEGYVVANDKQEGAKFDFPVWWESNFNNHEYQGVKSFAMNPGDEFAVMLVQNKTVQSIADDIFNIYRGGNKPIFSVPELNLGISQGVSFDADEDVPDELFQKALGQFVSVYDNGVYALEDIRVDQVHSDKDYNDFVFQIKGATTNTENLGNVKNSTRGWAYSENAQELLSYANRGVFEQGYLEVGESGRVIVDFLIDAGAYDNAEVGIFSLSGLDEYEIGSTEFVEEVINRVQSNTSEGYIVAQENQEDTRFTGAFPWETSDNDDGEYQGQKTLEFEAGDKVGLVLIPDGSFEDALLAPKAKYRKQPLFSMDTANLNDTIQFGKLYGEGDSLIVAFEDTHLNAGVDQVNSDLYYQERDRDYNDIVLGIQGVSANVGLHEINEITRVDRDWTQTAIATEMIDSFIPVI